MSTSNGSDQRPALGGPPPHASIRLHTIALGVAIVLALGGLTVAAVAARSPCDSVLQVRLAVGSENAPFFEDSRVQQIFRTQYCLDVQVTSFGSRQLPHVNVSKYDGFVPSSRITAEQLQSAAPSLQSQPQIHLFQSILAIATYQKIVDCLASPSLKIAYNDAGIWEFDVAKYLAAVQGGWRWSACGNSLPLLGEHKLLLTTTNPQCSNSGELFVADASYVKNNDSPVPDKATAAKVGGELAPMITEQGFMENTTDVAFQDYLTRGIYYTPMALIYESEFLGEEITRPGDMTGDMVLMYPKPDVYSERVLVPRDGLGSEVGYDVRDNPDLQRLAQEEYGFRASGPAEFQNIMVGHRSFGRNITVPAQLESGTPPLPDLLEDVINAANPPPPNPYSAC